MNQLWQLRFQMNRSIYLQLKVKQFLNNLPALDVIHILASSLDQKHLDYFIKRQGRLREFDISIVDSNILVRRKLDGYQSNKRLINEEF